MLKFEPHCGNMMIPTKTRSFRFSRLYGVHITRVTSRNSVSEEGTFGFIILNAFRPYNHTSYSKSFCSVNIIILYFCMNVVSVDS